jgi:hypothetical protein
MPLAPSQTFVAGDILTLNSNGQVEIIPVTSSNISASQVILGVAVDPAVVPQTNASPLSVAFTPAMPGMLWTAQIYHATAASAVWTPGLNVSGGSDFEVRKTAAGIWAVDIGHTSNKYARIVDVDPSGFPGYPNTTSTSAQTVLNPIIYFEFLSNTLYWGGSR